MRTSLLPIALVLTACGRGDALHSLEPSSATTSAAQVASAPAATVAPTPPPPRPASTVTPGRCGSDPPDPEGWVEIPAATFLMGKVTDEARLRASLRRPKDVTGSLVFLDPSPTRVARFWIARSPVTERAYAACVAAGACTRAATGEGCGGGGELPVNCVSHAQAAAYCAAVGARLPTEAEWELAARGPEGRIFAWGDAWKDEAAYDTRHPVGGCRLRDTPDGIHDLAGNGREWTATGTGDARISKGMACMDELPCVAFNRFIQPVDEQLDYLGFRCAGSAPPGAPPPFATAAPSRPKPTPTLHWSLLVDTFPTVRGPVRTRTVCFVDVRFDPRGRVVSATALAEGRPQQPACPTPMKQLAEAAARKATTAPREAGAETALPVAIEP